MPGWDSTDLADGQIDPDELAALPLGESIPPAEVAEVIARERCYDVVAAIVVFLRVFKEEGGTRNSTSRARGSRGLRSELSAPGAPIESSDHETRVQAGQRSAPHFG
ncbi:hypothetical protein [Amycolatopsis orientalis]|uniref:hypothetical protein n=1 Tax=Amycolatopsis orientalis TaxID=31958 RepID=UPI000399CF93|nr:hypothetical protein [Amycolatopsis orientalis]